MSAKRYEDRIGVYPFAARGDLQMYADVHTPGPGKRPVVLYYHPGGGILGSRSDIYDIEAFLSLGYIVVSPDYRLAPETQMPGMLEDALAAYEWLLDNGEHLFQADVSRIAVSGFSFGGYLAQLLGTLLVENPPKCILSISGYGELNDVKYLEKNAYYTATQPFYKPEEVLKNVHDRAICDGKTLERYQLYLMSRQQGIWLSMVYGTDDPEEVSQYSPRRHMTRDYPPICLIHSRSDEDVPYGQSVETAQYLKALGVAHRLVSLNGNHGINEAERKVAYAQIASFLEQWLGKEEVNDCE